MTTYAVSVSEFKAHCLDLIRQVEKAGMAVDPLKGLRTFDEFMTRRMGPAMATCATVSQRLGEPSERVAQASSLLSTRVDIVRERQNQDLLAATARRAAMQLKLQQTVEGLSPSSTT